MRQFSPFLVLLSGCAAFLSAPVPMASVRDPQPGAKCLLVFLPGAGDSAEDFARHGFVAALRGHDLSVDVVAANATRGYYAKGVLVERLHDDVIAPAQARGYQQTWLIGMSMGGLGTLLYSHDYPHEVTGVLALAPFLGGPSLIEELQQTGLARWPAPPPGPLAEATYQRELWRWLQAVTAGREEGPQLSIGWGRADRLGPAARVLAAALPPERVYEVDGAHAWGPWKESLEAFLARSDFSRSCASR